MLKLFQPFALYSHFLLDIILTHIFVIAFLHAGWPVTAGILMATDSILKVILLVFISRLSATVSQSMRQRSSLVLRVGLVGVWFIAITLISSQTLSFFLLSVFFVFKLMMMVDSSLSADFIFILNEQYHIDLTKSAAAQNILVRASTAFAPALALMLLTVPAIRDVSLVVAVLMVGISIVLLRKLFFMPHHLSGERKRITPLTMKEILANPLMRLGIYFQFLGNLAFSGVAFLLLSQLKQYGSLFFNDITALYTAFLILQFAVLLFGERIVPVYKLSHVALTMSLCGILVMMNGLVNPSMLRLSISVGVGLLYSLLLSGAQKVITAKLRGDGFIEYVSWAQTVSRLTAFVIISALGVGMGWGMSSSTLLILCGVIGIFGGLIMCVKHNNSV